MKLQSSMPLVLLSLLLSSCAMGPNYERPKIETADNFRMAEIEGESIANLPWWELLHDEQLQLLIRQALAENKDLKQAVASMEEFQARIFMARSDFLPGINVSTNAPAFGTLGGFVVPGFPTPFSYFGQGTLNWEIDIWGRVRRANEAARADLLAREENRRAVVLTLVSGVAQSYFDLLQLDMQLEITRRTLLSWEETVALSQHRLRGGVISRLDADQFEAERANVSARLAEIERQVMLLEVPAGLPSDLLQRRPDILQAEQTLAAATARIGMTKAARFPRITLTGLLGVASPRLANLLTSGTEYGMGGVGLAGPLLNAQTLGHEQRAFEAQSRRVLAQYEQTILVAFKEVEDSLVAVRTAKNQRKAQQEQVDALRSALQIANLRHQAGITSHLEVLVAKRSLFSAETALTSAHRLHLVSVVQLYKALGGGWSPG